MSNEPFINGTLRFRLFFLLVVPLWNSLPNSLKGKATENIVMKGEDAVTVYFLLFSQCFVPLYFILGQV